MFRNKSFPDIQSDPSLSTSCDTQSSYLLSRNSDIHYCSTALRVSLCAVSWHDFRPKYEPGYSFLPLVKRNKRSWKEKIRIHESYVIKYAQRWINEGYHGKWKDLNINIQPFTCNLIFYVFRTLKVWLFQWANINIFEWREILAPGSHETQYHC